MIERPKKKTSKLKSCLSIFFSAIFLFGFSSQLWGAQITFNPRIAIAEEYTDNIELSDNNREDDYITSISPGVTARITSKKVAVEASYDLSYVKYSRFDTNDTLRHRAGVSAGFDLNSKDKFELTNTFVRTEEPLAEEDPTLRRSRRPYFTNAVTTGLVHRFDTTNSAFLRYAYRILENEDAAIEDNQMHNPTLGLTYWFTRRFGIEGNAAFTRGEFETSDNFDEWFGSIRFITHLNRRLDGFLQYNHTFREHEGNTENYQVYDPSIGINFALSKDHRISLRGGYFFQNRRSSDDEDGFSGSVDLTSRFKRGSIRLSGTGGFVSTDFGAENLGSTRFYQINANILYQLMRQLSARIYGQYRTAEYIDQNREDDLITSGFNLSYQPLKWLSLSLDYSYRNFDSNLDTNDYYENRVLLNATITPTTPLRISD